MLSSTGSQSFAAQTNLANLALTQGQSVTAPSVGAQGSGTQDVAKAAQQFAGMFMSQMFSHMFEGVGKDAMFGGGQGEEMFRSVLVDEYGKAAAKSGSLGISDKIMHALIAQQEVKS
jgi:Rod binding domain-containing protein